MGFGNKIKNAIKRIVKMPKKYIVTIILGVMVIITGAMAIKSGNLRRPLNYPSSLDVVAITVVIQKSLLGIWHFMLPTRRWK